MQSATDCSSKPVEAKPPMTAIEAAITAANVQVELRRKLENQLLLSIRDTAAVLDIHRTSVMRLMKSGTLVRVEIGDRAFATTASVLALATPKKEAPSQAA
jgi:hypothetical protein